MAAKQPPKNIKVLAILRLHLKRLYKVLDRKLTDEQACDSATILNEQLQKLKDLPIETRRLLGIMVMRSYKKYGVSIVPIHEIEKATGLETVNIIQNVEMLERRGIITDIEIEDEIPTCRLSEDPDTLWPYWEDIREFIEKTGIPIERICCELDFSVFDE